MKYLRISDSLFQGNLIDETYHCPSLKTRFAFTEAIFPIAHREDSPKVPLLWGCLWPALSKLHILMSMWTPCFQSVQPTPCSSMSHSAYGSLHTQITQPSHWLWALVPACPIHSLFTFTRMPGPILLWLLTALFHPGPLSLLSPPPSCLCPWVIARAASLSAAPGQSTTAP